MNPTKKIALILTVIFLLPAIFFSVYEISSLSKDEKMIEEIYYKQLEAIIFSVNQYSDDALNSWVYKLESSQQKKEEDEQSALQNLLSLNSSISLGFVIDSLEQKTNTRILSLDTTLVDSIRILINEKLGQSVEQINQLIKYRKSGFQKVEALKSEHLQMVIFIIEGSSNSLQVAGLIIDPEIFIEDLIGPRCQVIAKDQFVISAFNKNTNSIVYSTLQGDTTSLSTIPLAKDLWIFPDYALGIRTEGASVQQLVQERTNTNLILLLGLDVVLIVALALAFRSIRREVQLAQNKSDFVSNVSHEIRTPLALISMFAETLEMGRVKSEEKKQEYYSIISKEANRLTGIVNKILSFSQTEAGKKRLQLETLILTNEVSEILSTYDFHLKSKGFEYSFEENSLIQIKADKQALAEILINLIDNAIKYSTEKKLIEITIGSDSNYGWISIKDQGLGISPQDQKHIFDKFYRVSSGNLAKSQGTGLGLSLVKQLMEQQNGKISVTSHLGQGSTFTLYFQLSN
jgi:two-component system, OmpR family, phosphate regulon sensor histidine kinase PhoR